MNEYQIELRVERATDRLDLRLMNGSLSQAEYDREISILDKWAQQQYDAASTAPFLSIGREV
jgi:hypothetical protein